MRWLFSKLKIWLIQAGKICPREPQMHKKQSVVFLYLEIWLLYWWTILSKERFKTPCLGTLVGTEKMIHQKAMMFSQTFSGVKHGSSFSTREASRKPTRNDVKNQRGELLNTRLTQKHSSGWVTFKCQKYLWIFP